MLVEEALRHLFKKEISISTEEVKAYIALFDEPSKHPQCQVDTVNISLYDNLLTGFGGCL
jgi:hypothetical protein